VLNKLEMLIQACRSLIVLRHFTAEHIFEVYVLCSAWISQCTSIIGNLLNLCQHTADMCGPIAVTLVEDGVLWQAVVSSVIYSFLAEKLGNFLTRWATLVSQGVSGVRVKGFILLLAKVRYVVATTLTYFTWLWILLLCNLCCSRVPTAHVTNIVLFRTDTFQCLYYVHL